MTDDELVQAVLIEARATVAALAASRPDEHLSGYALATDDDLSTLFLSACTREAAAQHAGDAYFLYTFTDWPYGARDAFSAVGDALSARASAAPDEQFEEHVARSFEALVRGLHAAKTEGLFGDDVFLTVGSTDPGEDLQRLEADAVKRLNSAAVFERWRAVMR